MNNIQNDDYGTNLNTFLDQDDLFSAMRVNISCDDDFLIPTTGDHFNKSLKSMVKGPSDFREDFNDNTWSYTNGNTENSLLTPSTFNESLVLAKVNSLNFDSDSGTNGVKGNAGQGDLKGFMESVDITNFLCLAIENTTYTAKLKKSTMGGLIKSGLMPDNWTEHMEGNFINFPADPRPEIRALVNACNTISRSLADCLHVAICKLISCDGCQLLQSHNSTDTLKHLRSCRLMECETDNCIKYRKMMEHFCSCEIQLCYVCRTLFISIGNMCDATNFDHARKKITRGTPEDPNDIFDVLFNSYLRFSEKVLPSMELSPKKGDGWDKIPPFFVDGDIQPLLEPIDPTLTCETIYSQNIASQTKEVCTTQAISPVPSEGAVDVAKPVNKDRKADLENPKALKDIYYAFINSMYTSPEGFFFLNPVDPDVLGIPDYFEIIREPMDLGTILKKMSDLEYKSHWDVIYDVNLVFDNAFMYNKKITRVHKHAVKLSQKFNAFSTQVMKTAGYCCNKRYVYTPQPMYCSSPDFCTIPVNTYYYRFDDKIFYCSKCYDSFGEFVECISEYVGSKRIKKDQFTRTRNNETVYEPFVSCEICHKRFHKVCVSHVDSIDGLFYYCDDCFKTFDIPRPVNSFISNNLPEGALSAYIEKRVNDFMNKEITNCKYIRIRMICNIQKILMTKQGLCARFNDRFPCKFPYKSKALFAFQETGDGKEVCFFSMHVQEYDDSCPHPNKRRVYLSYLDSVHYLHPKNYKTRVYHEILLSYLGYCKDRGFEFCHIWSCPPCEGDDYVFHCHSYEQKLPKPRRLLDWYNKMIELGIQKEILIDCKDIFKYFENFSGDVSTSIPYFDGDYWSNSLEDLIIEYEKEFGVSFDVQASNNATSILPENLKSNRKAVQKKKSTGNKNAQEIGMTLNQKLISLMDKYKEVFFVIRLNQSGVPFVEDPDPILQSELMEGRSGFLSLCRENHWEFSSFRHAVYSTKATMYVVHQQMYNFAEYCCDKCKSILVTGYHCDTCTSDYDLCCVCYKRFDHDHPLTFKEYVDLDDKTIRHKHDPTPKTVGLDQYNQNESHKMDRLARFCRSLVHASFCKEDQCNIPCCPMIKGMLEHYERCDIFNRTDCEICYELFKVLCSHSKSCNLINCKVPSCSRIKSVFRRNHQDNSKKIMSRINKMNAQLEYQSKDEEKEKEKEKEPHLTLRERKHRQALLASDDEESPAKKPPTSIVNDPLFEIPPTNVPANFSYGSLRGNNSRSTANPAAISSVSDNNVITESRTQSRRGRKPNSNKGQHNREITAPIDNSGMNSQAFFPASRLEATSNMNQVNKPNENPNRQTPVLSFDQGLQPTLYTNIQPNAFINNDGTLVRIPNNYPMVQPVSMNSNIGCNPVMNRQSNRTPFVIRNLPNMDPRFPTPNMMPFNVNIPSNPEMFRNNANIANLSGQQTVYITNDSMGPRGNFQPNMVEVNMRSTPTGVNDGYGVRVANQQSMNTGNIQHQGHVMQTNNQVFGSPNFINTQNPNPRAPMKNIVYRPYVINSDTGMNAGNIQMMPNSNIVFNNPNMNVNQMNSGHHNLSLSQMNVLTMQQAALLSHNQANRHQNIVINGADKQIISNTPIRGNMFPNGAFINNNTQNNMNPVIIRQMTQPNANTQYSFQAQPMNPNMNTRNMMPNYQIQDPNNPRTPQKYMPNASHPSNS